MLDRLLLLLNGEDEPAARELVQAHCLHGDQRRMPRVGGNDSEPDLDLAGVDRDGRGRNDCAVDDQGRFALMSWYFEEMLADFAPYADGSPEEGFQIIGTSGTVTTVVAVSVSVERSAPTSSASTRGRTSRGAILATSTCGRR